MAASRGFDAKAAAAKARGLAPLKTVNLMLPGAVFNVPDLRVVLPEARVPGRGARTVHPTRPVILVSPTSHLRSGTLLTLLVVPCSASHKGVCPDDFEIPANESAFDQPRVVAYVSLVQPMLKSDLGTHAGQLSVEALAGLLAALKRRFAD